ncbi:unnamed protein product, partial [Durusdinium trenchii]
DLRLVRPDGCVLDLERPLAEQGLLDDDLLRVAELWAHGRAAPVSTEGQHMVTPSDLLRKAEESMMGDAKEALAGFDAVLKVLEEEEEEEEQRRLAAQAFFGRARVHLRCQDWSKALHEAQRSLELQPEHLDAMCCEALALKELGELPNARARLGWVLLKDPHHRVAKGALASIQKDRLL